jgi:hypothetical protein
VTEETDACVATALLYGGRSWGVFGWYFEIPSPNTTVFGSL